MEGFENQFRRALAQGVQPTGFSEGDLSSLRSLRQHVDFWGEFLRRNPERDLGEWIQNPLHHQPAHTQLPKVVLSPTEIDCSELKKSDGEKQDFWVLLLPDAGSVESLVLAAVWSWDAVLIAVRGSDPGHVQHLTEWGRELRLSVIWWVESHNDLNAVLTTDAPYVAVSVGEEKGLNSSRGGFCSKPLDLSTARSLKKSIPANCRVLCLCAVESEPFFVRLAQLGFDAFVDVSE